MKSKLFLAPFLLALSLNLSAADLRQGLVSYWPLDTNDVSTTPDIVSSNNFTLVNFDPTNLVAGRFGNAHFFNGSNSYAYVDAAPDSGLPISHAAAFSVMLWVKGVGTGQVDRRAFSEGSILNNDPLFNIGTHSAGTTNVADIFIRNNGVALVNHVRSTNMVFDGTWHHVAWVDVNGDATLYVDGVPDFTNRYTRGTVPLTTTSIGAIVRAAAGAFYAGAVDEVGVWDRALSQAEIQQAMTNTITGPFPAYPLAITVQPSGSNGVPSGINYTFRAGATGARPITYQWRTNGIDIPGANSPTLILTAVTTNESATYSVLISNPLGSTNSSSAVLTVLPPPPPNLTNGIVAYWPLDEIRGTKTPDLVNGYDLNLQNLTNSDVVAGQKGNAFSFVNARRTLLSRVHSSADLLPINKHLSFTISYWALVNGVGQNDLRMFSEGNTAVSDPLFNIGTDGGGANGQIDLFIRQAGINLVDHAGSIGQPLDGAVWRHVVFVQENGARRLFIDGAQDPMVIPSKIPATGIFNFNNTSVGGILRTSASHWITGLLDEVALWQRALTAEEIGLLYTNGVPPLGPSAQPLAIRSFAPDFSTVTAGDSVVLRWDVSPDASTSISPGLGNVTSNSQFGVGSASVTVSTNTPFVITLNRGNESLSATTLVSVVSGVASGWRVLDTFENRTNGLIRGQGNWSNPEGVGTVVDLGANKALSYEGGQDLIALNLRSLALREGQSGTLFFRVYIDGVDLTNQITVHAGLTEKPIRFIGDFAGDFGPFTRIERVAGDFGPINVQARNGFGAPFETAPVNLQTITVYNFWIDVQNGTNDTTSTADIFSIHFSTNGVAGRTTLFTNFVGDRNPAGSPELGLPRPDLDSLVLAILGAGQGTNQVLMDDFFISGSGYLDTVPIAARSFATNTVVLPEVRILPPQLAAGPGITITWNTEPGARYTIQRKQNIMDPWANLVTGYPAGGAVGTSTTFTDPMGTRQTSYYRVVRE